MKVYIRASACISAQNTFGDQPLLQNVVEYFGTRLSVIEPDYKQYVDPKLIRRMGHVIKMGVAAAKECLAQGNTEMPGAIITGTAFGCIEDTVTFLTRTIESNEEMLPPTAFIQSTHNTVAAQIALMLQCHNYNNTFVHKGISFESALFDAVMLLKEHEADNVLVGGVEEMVDTSFTILTRLGLYKRFPLSNLDLYKTETKGTIGGQGAAFFLLTDKISDDNLAELTAIKTLYKPIDLEASINSFLKENATNLTDIDLILTGKNGDVNYDKPYRTLEANLFKNSAIANYKHLCGEYSASSSFGLWLAASILKKGEVPAVVSQNQIKHSPPKTILLYSHYQNKYHSLMLVSAI